MWVILLSVFMLLLFKTGNFFAAVLGAMLVYFFFWPVLLVLDLVIDFVKKVIEENMR